MSRTARASWWLVALISGWGGGCPFGDPGGPGASGSVTLASGVTTEGYQSLRVRAFPDTNPPASGATPALPTEVCCANVAAVAGLAFPYKYRAAKSLGTTRTKSWRVVAWLSKSAPDAPEPVTLATGDRYATRAFQVASCRQYGGYCAVTPDVDLAIDTTVP